MTKPLEHSVEEFFIALFRADKRTKGIKIAHFDEVSAAETNCIVMEAKQGAHQLAGPGGFDVDLSIEYRAPGNFGNERINPIASALWEIVYQSSLPAVARETMARSAGLSDLLIKDESTGDRSHTKSLRKRRITLPLQAGLAV